MHARIHTNRARTFNFRSYFSVVMMSTCGARHRILSATSNLYKPRSSQGGRCLFTTRSPAARVRAGESDAIEVTWDGRGWERNRGGQGGERNSGSSKR